MPNEKQTLSAQFELGETVYNKWCKPGHDEHPTHAGTHALKLKYEGAKAAHILDRTDLTAERIREVVRGGSAMMPAFRKTEISDEELDALIYFMLETSKQRNNA
jgi:cytochrome c5